MTERDTGTAGDALAGEGLSPGTTARDAGVVSQDPTDPAATADDPTGPSEGRPGGTDFRTREYQDAPVETSLEQIATGQTQDDQDAYLTVNEVDKLGLPTPEQIYEGELEAGVHDDLPGEPVEQNLEMLTELELRGDETDDPFIAAEEGFTYIAPIDPPVVPSADSPEGIEVAAGMGHSALDEPFDADHHSDFLTAEDEMSARVREALRADASTSRFADQIKVLTRGGVVILRGVVDDVEDTDNAAAVASYVDGVIEVNDELEVRALG